MYLHVKAAGKYWRMKYRYVGKEKMLALGVYPAVKFHARQAGTWSASYAEKWLRLMGKDLFPRIGKLPLVQINAPALLNVLRRVALSRGHPYLAPDCRAGVPLWRSYWPV